MYNKDMGGVAMMRKFPACCKKNGIWLYASIATAAFILFL
jgi:hypothetical protein